MASSVLVRGKNRFVSGAFCLQYVVFNDILSHFRIVLEF